MLYDDQESAAELYCSLTGERCRPDEVLIITITTVISGKMKNDLAFVVRGKAMVISEHMSSPYENLPVRLLMYTGQLYEKFIKMMGEEEFLYKSTIYKIPAPRFAVFYNGTAKRPEKEILRLSSAYEEPEIEGMGKLELEAPVYNINKGMNEELFEKSPKLKQYSEFIAKVRELSKLYGDYAQAVREATNYCIANNILVDFLRKQGGRIVSILTAEYDVEVAKRVYGDERAEEALAKRNIEFAKAMIAEGDSVEKVMRCTKLTREQVENLYTT